ncbi:zinc ribbon domain-containing protein [Novosphingobium sp. MMS21-SN21R]|uniref:Zn-ribbon domain-containing OB-fold protein n=1 Tax=Novosphingobium sp. MMS21-SN21R TaxID=2969298 RepID=UPI002885F3D2|nr:zinc ribbon domain-containing protein [Novosphingobium sp. MMS21-SN21R]MDT0509876.1 zinc ribbon domain-containing protein [Novosphingobium sp. MMS21-SN21R]
MTQKRPNRTLGPGHDEFWAGCAQGELRIQRCTACGNHSWPVISACEHCGSTDLAFNTMCGKGKVVSWCSFVQDYYRGVMPVPYDTIMVELEEGPIFLSNPADFSYDDITFEMPVEVTFVDAEDAAGPFSLPVFRKA